MNKLVTVTTSSGREYSIEADLDIGRINDMFTFKGSVTYMSNDTHAIIIPTKEIEAIEIFELVPDTLRQ